MTIFVIFFVLFDMRNDLSLETRDYSSCILSRLIKRRKKDLVIWIHNFLIIFKSFRAGFYLLSIKTVKKCTFVFLFL